jgi:hypothetical protein
MGRVRTRYKVLAWVALGVAGLLFAAAAGPMYASYYWPKELAPNRVVATGPVDFDAMMLAVEKAKPIAATANRLTAFGRFVTACAAAGMALTVFMHYRKRNQALHNPARRHSP